MHRPFLPGHGLRIAVAALVSLAVAPAAGAEDGVPIVVDPVVMATSLVDASLAGLPALPLESTLPAEPPPAAVPEAVAAAAEPIPAQEPQPTPPPPQPQIPDPATPLEELAPPPEPPPAPVEQPQYQPETPQYQPEPEVVASPDTAPAPAEPPEPAAPPAEEWSWDWAWSCGEAPAQMPAVEGDVLPDTWNWNWEWNCDSNQTGDVNREEESSAQYQPAITQYHPVNVNVSIRIGSPGNDGPVTQTNVVVVVKAQPVVATVEIPAAALTAAAVPPAEQAAAAPPDSDAPAAAEELPAKQTSGAGLKAKPKTMFASANQSVTPAEASSWNARPIPPRRLQPTKTEAHRSRPKLRRPTRRPLPPLRVPMIPVSSAGAAPLGGSDGGGFQFALLLVPFALALVDSARRLVRDTAPPVGRGHKKRRKRPG